MTTFRLLVYQTHLNLVLADKIVGGEGVISVVAWDAGPFQYFLGGQKV